MPLASAYGRDPGCFLRGSRRSAAPRLPSYPRCGLLLQLEEGPSEHFWIVDVVEQGGEPHLFIPFCCLSYPFQLTMRVVPARCPGRVLVGRVPLGQTHSLHPLLRRLL